MTKVCDHPDQSITLGGLHLNCSSHRNWCVQTQRRAETTFSNYWGLDLGHSSSNPSRRNARYDLPSRQCGRRYGPTKWSWMIFAQSLTENRSRDERGCVTCRFVDAHVYVIKTCVSKSGCVVFWWRYNAPNRHWLIVVRWQRLYLLRTIEVHSFLL